MATTQSSSPFHSPQIRAKSTPAPPKPPASLNSSSACQWNRPNCWRRSKSFFPWPKTEYRQLSGPRSSSCDPRTAELIKNEADAWAIGIALAEDALSRIKPCPHLLVRYFHQLEKALTKAVQP